MKITYDKLADAAYLYFKKGKVSKTVQLADRLIIDLDRSGKIIGLEILEASLQLPKSQINRFKMHPSSLAAV